MNINDSSNYYNLAISGTHIETTLPENGKNENKRERKKKILKRNVFEYSSNFSRV